MTLRIKVGAKKPQRKIIVGGKTPKLKITVGGKKKSPTKKYKRPKKTRGSRYV